MLDISVAYNRYKFLGCEFLTWLWFQIDSSPKSLQTVLGQGKELIIGNRMVLENHSGADVSESIIIKGNDAGFEEAILALNKGAIITEINLIYKREDNKWSFSLKGESFHIIQLKISDRGDVPDKEEKEALVLEKISFYEETMSILDRLYHHFLTRRLDENWKSVEMPSIKKWMQMS